jgi:Outer membrane protein beta-barrel domain
MQSVRLKKSLTLPFVSYRHSSFLFHAVLLVAGMLALANPSRAQDTSTMQVAPTAREKFDVGVGGFYQITNASNGGSIREDTTSSGGALISFRQPYRPWLGYEVNFGYTKFYESYNKNTVKLQNNVTDVTLAYLLQAPTIGGFQPFFSIGGGVIVFSPVSGTVTSLNTTPTTLPTQLLPEFTYTFGLNYPLFSRLGLRGQIRGLDYKTPSFHQDTLNTHTLRNTLEPTLSVYYRF